MTFGPEDVLHYAYAVFHSREYRRRYAEHLPDGFPRLPLPGSATVFRCLCAGGAGLARLHLFEDSGRSRKGIITLRDKGTREIAPGYPRYEDGRVWINATRWFAGVTPNAWNCPIGAHQVCVKWLKDRRGRCLTNEEVARYRRMVAVLEETLERMTAIDRAIGAQGGWPAAFAAAT